MTTMVGSKQTKDSRTLVFSGTTPEKLGDRVALFLAERGYRIESGTKLQGVYGRGSAGGYAIFGPLVRRQKYHVTISQNGPNVALVLARGMTGMGGGLLGASRVKKEYEAIVSGLQESVLSEPSAPL